MGYNGESEGYPGQIIYNSVRGFLHTQQVFTEPLPCAGYLLNKWNMILALKDYSPVGETDV